MGYFISQAARSYNWKIPNQIHYQSCCVLQFRSDFNALIETVGEVEIVICYVFSISINKLPLSAHSRLETVSSKVFSA